MLVNLDVAARQMQFNRMWVVALALTIALGAQVYMVIHYAHTGVDGAFYSACPPRKRQHSEPNSEAKSAFFSLFTEYMLPFEIASVMLLVAMIGAVVMAKRKV